MLKIVFKNETIITDNYSDKFGQKQVAQLQMNKNEVMYVANIQDDMYDKNYIHIDVNRNEWFGCPRNAIEIIEGRSDRENDN